MRKNEIISSSVYLAGDMFVELGQVIQIAGALEGIQTAYGAAKEPVSGERIDVVIFDPGPDIAEFVISDTQRIHIN
jgi:hypothetical protein